MGDFSVVAEAIKEAIKDTDISYDDPYAGTTGVRPEDIPGIIESASGANSFNCYPGRSTNRCFEMVYFVSLNSRRYAKGRGHPNFEKTLELLIRHMQGLCPETTTAVIITDSWDARIFEKWRDNISKIKNKAHIEVHLISPAMHTEIHI